MNVEKVYEVEKTDEFSSWLAGLKDSVARVNIASRIARVEEGSIGDNEHLGDGLNEMRVHCGAGYRLYWFRAGKKIILLAYGGSKSSQKRDIKKARKLMQVYKEERA